MADKKKLMIALPGNQFSNQFLMAWTQFLIEVTKNPDFEISICPGYSTFSTHMRMKTLGITKQEAHTKAFDNVTYDVFLTIDPTIIFTYQQVKTIVSLTEKYPVVAGHYLISDKNICAIESLDYEYFAKHGTFEYVTRDKLESKEQEVIKVDYSGMGFMACRRAVLQSLDYPYFWYPMVDYTSEDGMPCKDVLTDDMAFCRRLKDKGFRITIPFSLRVHQEKQIVL